MVRMRMSGYMTQCMVPAEGFGCQALGKRKLYNFYFFYSCTICEHRGGVAKASHKKTYRGVGVRGQLYDFRTRCIVLCSVSL